MLFCLCIIIYTIYWIVPILQVFVLSGIGFSDESGLIEGSVIAYS